MPKVTSSGSSIAAQGLSEAAQTAPAESAPGVEAEPRVGIPVAVGETGVAEDLEGASGEQVVQDDDPEKTPEPAGAPAPEADAAADSAPDAAGAAPTAKPASKRAAKKTAAPSAPPLPAVPDGTDDPQEGAAK
jgi:hypothetical protein